MRFCGSHWTAMRKAVDDRAMTRLVARDGQKATENMQAALRGDTPEDQTFDPLMTMHWQIVNNVMETLQRASINPLHLLASGGPDEGHWCPLCVLNTLHAEGCTDPQCQLDKERGYDWMVERSAQDALAAARALKLVPAAS